MIWFMIAITIRVSVVGFRDPSVFRAARLDRTWPSSLVTYGFVHRDWPHLMFNVIMLASFGWDTRYATTIYLLGLVLSALPAWWIGRRGIGASGGALAVMFAWLAQHPSPGVVLAAVSVAGYLAWSRHPVHFWGALTGVIVTVIVGPT